MTTTRFTRVRTVGALAALVVCGAQIPAQSPTPLPYGVMQFGLTAGTNSAAYDVGEYGQAIVGRSRSVSGPYHAFVDGYFGRQDLGTLGGSDSTAFAFQSGTIVGQAQLASGQYRAFAYDLNANTMTNLGTLGGTWSAAYAINSFVIVGASRIAGDVRLQAFRHDGGTMSAVAVDRGGDSVAKSVNGWGEIVGYACTSGNAQCRAFLATAAGTIELGPSSGNSVANGINDAQQIVGAMPAAGGTTHAFLHHEGTTTDLGTLGGPNSEALAINEAGDVVGWSHVAGGSDHAFVWRNGTMIDINTLLPPNSGWVLQSAKAISEGGQIVGHGTLGGVRRAFLLTPPTDLRLFSGGARTQEDSNVPRDGVEVGEHVSYSTSVVADGPGVTVYGAKMIHTLTGPAEFVAGRNAEPDGESCDVTPTVVTCDVPPIDSPGLGREFLVRARVTGPGAVTHAARIESSVPDPNGANNEISEANRGVALATFEIAPLTLSSGALATATIDLTGPSPPGDAIVRLSSSRPDVISVPATFDVLPWYDIGQFHIVPAPVSAPTTVRITATYGLVSITRTMTVVPTGIAQLYLTPTTVIGGCGTSTGRVLLSGAAPAGGAVVSLTNTNPSASVPAAVTVAAGSHNSATFSVPTSAVTSNVSGTVTATYGGASKSLALTVRPIRAASVTLSPNPVVGGAVVNATLVLECPAAPGNVVVSLTSGNPAVAAATVSTVTVPAGQTTATFQVRTSAVTASTSVAIDVWVFGVRKTAVLAVVP